MLEPGRPWLVIATAWACTFFPSLALSWMTAQLLPGAERPAFQFDGALALFLLVVFAPLAETLIMAGALIVMLRFVPPAVAILLSAAGWGIAHSSAALAWGLVIWWPFLIFSTLFVVWRPRGIWRAIGLVTCVHGLHNLLPALMIASN